MGERDPNPHKLQWEFKVECQVLGSFQTNSPIVRIVFNASSLVLNLVLPLVESRKLSRVVQRVTSIFGFSTRGEHEVRDG